VTFSVIQDSVTFWANICLMLRGITFRWSDYKLCSSLSPSLSLSLFIFLQISKSQKAVEQHKRFSVRTCCCCPLAETKPKAKTPHAICISCAESFATGTNLSDDFGLNIDIPPLSPTPFGLF